MTVRQLEAKIKGEDQQTNEQNENLSIPENSKDIGSSINFLNSSPLIPNFDGNNNEETNTPLLTPFGNNSESENEPLIINSMQEENPLITTSDKQEDNISKDEEPLIMMPNNNDKKEDIGISNSNTENNKYINFGEIDDDVDDETDDEKFYEETNKEPSISFGEGPISANSAIDLDNLKQNTKDINLKDDNEPGADLDSLLRINNKDFTIDNNNIAEDNSFKFFSPAAEAIKDSENKDIQKNSEDYFKAPDLIGIDLPGEVPTYNTNNVPLSSNIENKITETPSNNLNNSLDEAIKTLNDALSKIEDLGIKVEKDEMNLEKSYQVIIKLEKNN